MSDEQKPSQLPDVKGIDDPHTNGITLNQDTTADIDGE